MGPIRQGRRHGGITHRLVMRLHSGTGATRRLGQEGRDMYPPTRPRFRLPPLPRPVPLRSY